MPSRRHNAHPQQCRSMPPGRQGLDGMLCLPHIARICKNMGRGMNNYSPQPQNTAVFAREWFYACKFAALVQLRQRPDSQPFALRNTSIGAFRHCRKARSATRKRLFRRITQPFPHRHCARCASAIVPFGYKNIAKRIALPSSLMPHSRFSGITVFCSAIFHCQNILLSECIFMHPPGA